MPYAIDLFCGAGGMSEGILQAGFQILFSSDINETVQKTYMHRHKQLGLEQNINTYYHRGDIKDLTGDFILEKIGNLEIFKNRLLPKIDAIFGGPPCQGFSRAGLRNPNDPRNMLFREYVRVINELKPDYVVLENVTGFTDTKLYGFKGVLDKIYPDGMCVPDILKEELTSIDYTMLKPKILNAADYGVPQRRNRIIAIAHKNGIKAPSYPKPTVSEENRITLKDAIGDLIIDDNLRKKANPKLTDYQKDSINGRTPDINGNPIPSKTLKNNDISNHLPLIKERFSLFKEGEAGKDIRNRIKKEGIDLSGKNAILNHLKKNLNLKEEEIIIKFEKGDITPEELDVLLTKKNVRHRLSQNEPSATVLTIPDDYISPFEDRSFSVREMARLQSFDDSFEFLGKRTTGGKRRRVEVPQYTQVGNAVPPLLAKAIALEILKVID